MRPSEARRFSGRLAQRHHPPQRRMRAMGPGVLLHDALEAGLQVSARIDHSVVLSENRQPRSFDLLYSASDRRFNPSPTSVKPARIKPPKQRNTSGASTPVNRSVLW